MNKKIAEIVVGLPVEGPFDYWVPDSLAGKIIAGMRVWVPFGSRKIVGYVTDLKNKSAFRWKLKPIIALIDDAPVIHENLLQLTKEFAAYYCCSRGEAVEAALPQALRKGKKIEGPLPEAAGRPEENNHEILLLHDKSMDKRWPVLIEKIRETLAKGKTVIFLVPEVILTSKVYEKLKSDFADDVIVLDKRLSAAEELKHWLLIKRKEKRLVIGTRSAVFAPAESLGLIIVEDEDNAAYKQEQAPFYHAREAALMRSRIEGAHLIFVGSVPSAEVWHMVKTKKAALQTLEADEVSQIQIVDMSTYDYRKSSILSFPLRSALEKILNNKGKAVLFLNRRGFTTSTRCSRCGFVLKCKRCNTNLTYLYDQKKMVCRHCSYTASPPTVCPECSSSYLRYTGVGIEKLESEVARMFPQSRVARYDKDTKNRPADFDVLMATQAVLKIQDELAVDLVAVLQFDAELHRPDFRSGHRAFSLLYSLRRLAREKLIVQTKMSDNYSLKAAKSSDFEKFYREELKFRKQVDFPPFQHLVAVMVRGAKEEFVFEQAAGLFKEMQEQKKDKGIEILDPEADMTPKLRGKYRFVVMLKAKSERKLSAFVLKVLKSFKRKAGVIVSINVDP